MTTQSAPVLAPVNANEALYTALPHLQTPEAPAVNFTPYNLSVVIPVASKERLIESVRKVSAVARHLDSLGPKSIADLVTELRLRCQEAEFAVPFWAGAVALPNAVERDLALTGLIALSIDYLAAKIHTTLLARQGLSPERMPIVKRVWNYFPDKRYITFSTLVTNKQSLSLEQLVNRTIPVAWWTQPIENKTPLQILGAELEGPIGRKIWCYFPELRQHLITEFIKLDPAALFDVRDLPEISDPDLWSLVESADRQEMRLAASAWFAYICSNPEKTRSLFEIYPQLPKVLMSLAQRGCNSKLLLALAETHRSQLVFEPKSFPNFMLSLCPEDEGAALLLLEFAKAGQDDVNALSDAGFPLMSCAVFKNFTAVAHRLLELGCDINQLGSRGWGAIHQAVSQNTCGDWLCFLHAYGANFDLASSSGSMPVELLIARLKNHSQLGLIRPLVSLILALGASVDDPRVRETVLSVFPDAMINPYHLDKEWLARAADPTKTILPLSGPQIASILGASQDKAPRVSTDTILGIFRRKEVCAAFDPNLGDTEGYPAMVLAVWRNSTILGQLFLRLECNINQAHQNGWTALHQAAYYMKMHMLNWLLQEEANPNCVDDDGHTPLHSLITRLKCGADVSAVAPIILALKNAGTDLMIVAKSGNTVWSEVNKIEDKSTRESLLALLRC